MQTSDATTKNFQVAMVSELLFQLHQWASGRNNAPDAIDKLVALYGNIPPVDDTAFSFHILLREALMDREIKSGGAFNKGEFFEHLRDCIQDIVFPYFTSDQFRESLQLFEQHRPSAPQGDVLEKDFLSKIVENNYQDLEGIEEEVKKQKFAESDVTSIARFKKHQSGLLSILRKYQSEALTSKNSEIIALLAAAVTLNQGIDGTERAIFLSWLRQKRNIDIFDSSAPPARRSEAINVVHIDAAKFNVDYALDYVDEALRGQNMGNAVRAEAMRDFRDQCQTLHIYVK